MQDVNTTEVTGHGFQHPPTSVPLESWSHRQPAPELVTSTRFEPPATKDALGAFEDEVYDDDFEAYSDSEPQQQLDVRPAASVADLRQSVHALTSLLRLRKCMVS